MSDPVRSIRVASTLLDRFRVLLSTSQINTDTLELAIGEAQQIYPEIWSHLDDARRALVERERDVSQFDQLRKHALAHLGVTDVDARTEIDYTALMFGRIRVSQVKTATFNVEGYELGTAACQALMGAMPEINWRVLAAAEAREIAAAGSMQSAKWLAILKWSIAGAAVVTVGILIHRFATRPSNFDDEPSQPRHPEGPSAAAIALEAKLDKIAILKATYAATCDRKAAAELVGLLRDESRLSEATKIDPETCVPTPPSCDGMRDEITARLVKRFDVARGKKAQINCRGITIGVPGGLVPALAIGFSGRAHDGEPVEMRGITAPDGIRELVPFSSSPEDSTLIGTGDLDGDRVDELVMAGDRGFIVSRIENGTLIDILGPTLTCEGSVNVERDFRQGPKSNRTRVVLEIPPAELDAPRKKGCLPSGRHYFGLVRGALVED